MTERWAKWRLQGGMKKAESSSRWAGLGRDGYGPILLLTGWLLMKKPRSETKLGRAKTLPGLLGGGVIARSDYTKNSTEERHMKNHHIAKEANGD